MAITTCLSIITLSVNDLNAPINRHRVVEWLRKQNPHIRDPPQNERHTQTKNKGLENDITCK